MDPDDTSVEKKFFILDPTKWGLGNWQIRVVTALMVAILTK